MKSSTIQVALEVGKVIAISFALVALLTLIGISQATAATINWLDKLVDESLAKPSVSKVLLLAPAKNHSEMVPGTAIWNEPIARIVEPIVEVQSTIKLLPSGKEVIQFAKPRNRKSAAKAIATTSTTVIKETPKYKLAELKELAKAAQIKGYYKMNKAELIKALGL